jgi:hypothetical protein
LNIKFSILIAVIKCIKFNYIDFYTDIYKTDYNLTDMRRKPLPLLIALLLTFSGCAMFESIVKSTFPYTTTLTVSASALTGTASTAISMATSFDQDFTKDGNSANHVSEVRIVSAKLRSIEPSDFNIGNLQSASFYISNHDGSNEVLVASRTDIEKDAGNSIVLDIDNSNFLDKLIRQPDVRIRMVYKLRNKISADANLRLVLGLSAYPNNN